MQLGLRSSILKDTASSAHPFSLTTVGVRYIQPIIHMMSARDVVFETIEDQALTFFLAIGVAQAWNVKVRLQPEACPQTPTGNAKHQDLSLFELLVPCMMQYVCITKGARLGQGT